VKDIIGRNREMIIRVMVFILALAAMILISGLLPSSF
jgi:hypothetical protein